MTNPRNATTTAQGRSYTWPPTGEVFPSVTTLLRDGIPKPALVAWGPKMAAEFVADNLPLINQLADQPHARQLIIDMVKGSPYRERDAAAGIGTLIHEVAEAMVLDLPLPAYQDKHAGFVKSLRMFMDDWRPQFEASEATVYHRAHCWAGTLDFIARFPGIPDRLFLGDWKTTKPGRHGHGAYPEAALQTNCYANAEFIGMPDGTEVPMPQVDDLVVVNLRPNGYKVIPIEKSDALYRTFRYVQQVAQFQKSGFESLGEPLAPPEKVEVEEQQPEGATA